MSTYNAAKKAFQQLEEVRRARADVIDQKAEKLYCLSYDLHEGDNYNKLIAELERMNAQHWLDSTWVFNSPNNLTTVNEQIRNFFPEDKGYLLAEVNVHVTGRPAEDYRGSKK